MTRVILLKELLRCRQMILSLYFLIIIKTFKNLKNDILKKRSDAKLNKNEILFGALFSFGKYGKTSPYTNIVSEEDLKKLNAKELVSIINSITSYEHHILYYGNNSVDEVAA